MNSRLRDLLVGIVAYVTQQDGYVTKTKLLKLIYLLDVEFYRVHRRTFSGFDWKYFHLGPWTNEFDPLLSELVSRGDLTENVSKHSDYDTKFLRADESVPLKQAFENYADEAILKTLLDTWGTSSTGEILDYVYFRTEPMEHGMRNEKLDFSSILHHAPDIYKRSTSSKSRSEINKLRKEFEKKIAARPAAPSSYFSEPRYDQEFQRAMEKLDSGDL